MKPLSCCVHITAWALLVLLLALFSSTSTNGQTIQDDFYIVPIPKVIVPEYGSVSLSPQIYFFNDSYSSSSLNVTYSMADGSALISGMSVFNNVFSFYSNPSHVGQLSVLRNVTYYNRSNKLVTVSQVTLLQVIPTPTPNLLPLLFSENFTSGGLTKWNLLDGTIRILSNQLNLFQNNTKVVSANSFNLNLTLGITWTFNLLTSWTSSRGIIIYVDNLNYYEINLSNSPLTINRYVNGQLTVVSQNTKLVQVHTGNYYSNYKVYLQYTTKGIVINIAKIGTIASDYILNVVDSFTNMERFKNVKLGFYDKSISSPTLLTTFKVLQCQVFSGKLIHSRQGVTYHVDGTNGNDSNSGLSKASAFKTLNTAQNQLLPDDTLIVYDSIYRENVQINRQASAEHPITIKAFNQPTAKSTFTTNPYTHTAIIDGSLILDASKFTKIPNSNIYQISLKFTPSAIYQNGVKMSIAMKPLPSKLQDEFFVKNYINPIGDSFVSPNDSSIIYLQLHDMFKYDNFGNRTKDDYWNGGYLYHYVKASIFVQPRKILAYNAATNTVALRYSEPGWPNLKIVTNDTYAIGNHVGCISQVGQYVSSDNVISVSLSTAPSQFITLEAPALVNGIKFANGMEGFNIQGLMVRKFTGDGMLCSGQCTNLMINNCSAKYNGDSGLSFSYSSNIVVDGGESSQNNNNGIEFGGVMTNSTIQNTYVHENINNGIWVGNSGTNLFYAWNILLKSNKVGPHYSEKLHPDNIQFTNVDNITLDSNIMYQESFQNMWMEKNGLVTFKNNVFINGPVGVNHLQNLVMINNVFYQSFFRFGIKYESFVPYSSLVGLESVKNWKAMFNSINGTTSDQATVLAKSLVWSGMNSQLYNRIKSYSNSSLTSVDQISIVDHINSVINNTSFMKQFKNTVLPLLGTEHVVALPYWNAITKRGLLDKSTGQFTLATNNITIIEEVRGLTRAILDELVFNGILDKSFMTYYPRIVSIKNNAFITSYLQLPTESYSLLPYWDSDFNFIEHGEPYHINIWKSLAGPNTVFETTLTNATLYYFTNMTQYDFHLKCSSNITLIDKGINVGLPYFGKAPDIGVYESNCSKK